MSWLKSKLGKKSSRYTSTGQSKGGVDAGRGSFARYGEKETKQKRNLLKKLNLYWIRKKEQSQPTYQSAPESTGWRKVLLVVALICAVGLFFKSGGLNLAGTLLEDLDYFRITSIRVQGCVNSEREQVRNASGIKISSSLLAVDEKGVSASVKEQNPWVDAIHVSRQWPDTLVLQVTEYKPNALITLGSEDRAELHYLDRSGKAFVKTTYGMDLDLPVVTGLENRSSDKERADDLKDPLQFLRLVGANNPNLPIQSVSEVHVDAEEGLIVYLVEHPFPIFFGDGEVRQKYVRLRKVLEMLYRPRRTGMDIGRVAYIRMNYLKDKVIVGYSEPG